MTTLLLNNIENIDLNKISLKKSKNIYNIFYNQSIILKGIPMKLKGITHLYNDKYFYELYDINEINFMKKIDNHFNSLLINYQNTIKMINNKYGIIFNKNDITDKYLSDIPKEICINIKYISSKYNSNLIIHLID